MNIDDLDYGYYYESSSDRLSKKLFNHRVGFNCSDEPVGCKYDDLSHSGQVGLVLTCMRIVYECELPNEEVIDVLNRFFDFDLVSEYNRLYSVDDFVGGGGVEDG